MPSARTPHVYRTTCAGIDLLRIFLNHSVVLDLSVQTVTLQRLRAADDRENFVLAGICGQSQRSRVSYSDSYNFVLITSYCKASNREFLCPVTSQSRFSGNSWLACRISIPFPKDMATQDFRAVGDIIGERLRDRSATALANEPAAGAGDRVVTGLLTRLNSQTRLSFGWGDCF